MRRCVAPQWTVGCDEQGLVVTHEGSPARIRVAGSVAANVVRALSSAPVRTDLSPLERRLIVGLDQRGAITIEVVDGNVVLARHEPAQRSVPRVQLRDPSAPPRAHPTTVLAREGNQAVAVGARCGDRVVLLTPRAVDAAARTFAPIGDPGDTIALEVWDLMHRARLLEDGGDSVVDGWELHDALFHAASRNDTRSGRYGATFPKTRAGVAVPIHRPTGGRRIPLGRLDLPATGLPLSEALERRRSERGHDGAPIRTHELGALLDGSLRVTRTISRDDGELAWRRIPTGGARSGLGAVVVVARGADLEDGVYEYDPIDHELVHGADLSDGSHQWLQVAAGATGIPGAQLQCLVLLTLDYDRPAQKYERIVYATALKEVGAVLQSMALVGTALGLSFCPVGGGRSSTASLRLASPTRAVIGEAAVGRAAPDAPRLGDCGG